MTNSRGDILLAQRSFNKNHDPGKWGPAVAGTVEQGETYRSNIIKEAAEEIGLKNFKMKKGPKTRSQSKHNYFSQRFFTTINKPASKFKTQKEEVEKIKWFTREQLKKEIKHRPNRFLPSVQNFEEILK